MDPRWLDWAKRLAAISQNGLTYNDNPFDIERYQAVGEVAAEIMAAGFDVPPERVRDAFKAQSGYATPKVDVRGVVVVDGRMLLVREKEDGCWTLPGGWADVCESPSEAVAREIREEAGYEVAVRSLLGVYDRSKHPHVPPFPFHVYKLFFRCEIVGEQSSLSGETSEARFFPQDGLPELSISRVTPQQIQRFFELDREPNRPADFD